MRKVMIVLVALFGFALLTMPALAREKKVVIEDGNLVVFKSEVIATDVPEGLDAQVAWQLVKGEMPDYTLELQGEETYSFSFPIKKKSVRTERVISYSDGWQISEPKDFTESGSIWSFTIFWLIIPVIGILVVSIASQITNTGDRKILVFYLAVILSVVFGALIGTLIGGRAGVLAGGPTGMFVGGLAGMFAGAFAGLFAGGIAGGIAGIFTGGLAGMFAGAFAGMQGFDIASKYLVFLIAGCAVSFLVAKMLTNIFSSKKVLRHPMSQ